MCTEKARIQLPWGGNILNYCPVHANQLVILSNAMGGVLTPRLLPVSNESLCESPEDLTEEELELSKQFQL